MKSKYFWMIALTCPLIFYGQTIKILFDASKAETAGNADWIIDADNFNLGYPSSAGGAAVLNAGHESNAQRLPTPSQTSVTASTSETFWTGSLSYMGIDCVKQGYWVETLPYNGQITYGNSSNPQDLSNYNIFIVCEPNIKFSTSEKIAMMNFLINGGRLFMISDHTGSDRNNDGWDSPAIWNDFISNNGVMNNGFGFNFNLMNISGTYTNIINAPSDSVLNGPFGHVTQVKWSNGTTMKLTPSQNHSIKGVVYMNGASRTLDSALCVYGRLGNGKFAAIGDSSPCDDGTGNPNDNLYNGYTADANGNHRKLLMNIIIWLAAANHTTTDVEQYISNTNIVEIYPNPAKDYLTITFSDTPKNINIQIADITGKTIIEKNFHEPSNKIYLNNINELSNGIYFIKINTDGKITVKKLEKV